MGTMKKDILNLTIKAGMIFVVITVIFGVSYYEHAEMAKELLEVYLPEIQDMINEDGTISWLKLFRNNLFACALTVGMGFFPLIFLPIFTLLSNAVMTGAIFGLGTAEAGMDPVKSLIFGILPHGVFELTGLFLSVALGFYLCRTMTKKLFRRQSELTLMEVINNIAKIFVLVVIPLITLASVIECFATPAIMAWAGM